MNKQKNNGKLRRENRSEEVTDIIERMPVGWTWIVSAITAIIMMIVVALGFIISYPDTVSGFVSVTGEKSPVRIVTATTGRLRLLVEDNSYVQIGDCIGYIESGASYEDVMYLDSICQIIIDVDIQFYVKDSLKLGALSNSYNDFMLSYRNLDQLRKTKVYDNMRLALLAQKNTAQSMSGELKQKSQLYKHVLANSKIRFEGDSILHENGILSDEEISVQRDKILSNRQTEIELSIAEMSKQADVHRAEIELAQIDLDVEEKFVSAFTSLIAKHNILANELFQWKERYLFCSPIDGKLEYLAFLRENMFVSSNTELFSILPADNCRIGEMYMTARGAGKVQNGMDVNIKLADYPYDEYGYVRGVVQSVSKLSSSVKTEDGQVRTYLVRISFPNGMTTNYSKKLSPNLETAGTAEIITERRRLIERLFDNLKTIVEK